ncbi:hypothetical protein EVB39_054 [Rhizobium phage RHph_TM3_3_9]|nr:hypothetical protein EVB39_054 [Rhizobium phage RHph_TM3_3_9]QIG68575.1 hypothetical protein EVB66_054 [Rhizobium phage RHph_TM3_3_13]QIG74433.1 hypothetical protein EVC09_053 [Rhizobium phage RHph_TM3_3_10]QXV74547.1 hypothetical protein [Rhizobium phage RHEph19]
MIYNFAFIITDGVEYIDGDGERTPDRKRAHRYPYRSEAKTAATTFGREFRVQEVE